MSRVLVDTSVWVEMLRGEDSEPVRTLGDLLSRGLVCTNGLILAELLSGAKSQADYARLEDHLSALPYLNDPPELWETIASSRCALARKGFQAGIADLIVAASAAHHRKPLFTLDKAFQDIKTSLPLELLPIGGH